MSVVVSESGFVQFMYEDQGPTPGNEHIVSMLLPDLANIFNNDDPITLQSIGELMISAVNAEAVFGGNSDADYALVSISKPYVSVNVPIV